jgi:hypothetical protein
MWFSGLAINNDNPYKANIALSLSHASQLLFLALIIVLHKVVVFSYENIHHVC